MLAPLTGLVIPLVKYKWGEEQQKAFDEIKQKVSKETLLAFLDFEKEFHVYTDASNKYLGAEIMQEGKPLAFYSRKLSSAQTRYTTGEQ
jgi:glucose-6-phosphate isomerase